MTAHELAKALLAAPDVPVVINGWGSDEGFTFEVTDLSHDAMSFSGANDTKRTPRTSLGYAKDRMCVSLGHCGHTPDSDRQVKEKAAREKKRLKMKRTNPKLYQYMYPEITPLTPADIMRMSEAPLDGDKAP